ncbi:MAG: type II toxin-antitoxin system RelE/ParE family toxin [Gloeobacterales cyanobacterium]
MKVLWRRRAIEDLPRIRKRFDLDSKPRFIAHIKQVAKTLERFPFAGRPGRVSNTRELPVSNIPFVVPYTVGEQVEILAVIHGSLQWPEDLF